MKTQPKIDVGQVSFKVEEACASDTYIRVARWQIDLPIICKSLLSAPTRRDARFHRSSIRRPDHLKDSPLALPVKRP